MKPITKEMSRRSFLKGIAIAGGAAAVYETMTALGWIRTPEVFAGPPRLPAGSGNGQRVLILGAGVAGLTAAHTLRKVGYECIVLEAHGRPGGRNHTVRSGDYVIERDGIQTCPFDPDPSLYFNAGPGRISHHHRALIDLCQELGVRLELYVLNNRAALFQREDASGNTVMTNDQIVNDSRGYVSELLAKAVVDGGLDTELTEVENEKLLGFLKKHGDLTDNYRYLGSSRSGYVEPPGAGTQSGRPKPPIPLKTLLDFEFWQNAFYDPEEFDWQPTLFEPAGGMDQIIEGLMRQVGHLVHLNAEVSSIRNQPGGVRVSYLDWRDRPHVVEADFCISTIPVPLLSQIDNNFSADFRQAMGSVDFVKSCKVAWQAERRFWEDEGIYGGISWTNTTISQMWYPSNDLFSRKGILVGAYNYGKDAAKLGDYGFEKRLEVARREGSLVHPNFNDHIFHGMSIAWHKVPYTSGGWANYSGDRGPGYARLTEPEGRVYLAGSQLTYINGWQEGAVLSAYSAANRISQRVASAAASG